MSGRLRIRELRPSDENALRTLSECPMEGPIRLALPQTPNFFAAEALRGETRIGILTDDSDEVLGCGARVVREAWFDHAWRRTGYYCTLRATSAGRNARAVVTAYTWARQVEREDPLPIITSTIMSGNERARRLLTSRRFLLPAYLYAGGIVSFAVTARSLRHFGVETNGIEVLDGAEVGMKSLREFYEDGQSLQSLFPRLPDPLPPGLSWEDFVVLRRNGKIVAAAALWNQRAYRQIRVIGYGLVLRCLRPMLNLVAKVSGLPLLPCPGDEFAIRYLAFRKFPKEDQAMMAQLLRAAGARLPAAESLVFSVHSDDQLLESLNGLRAVRTSSSFYTLSYDDDPQPVDFGGVPYIEAAML